VIPLEFMVLFFLLLLLGTVLSKSITVSNTQLPVDQNNDPIITGEASVLVGPAGTPYSGFYYFYFNNWGGCSGVNCCTSLTGCASCCFNPPSAKYPDACVYTTNHSVVVYKTPDFSTWIFLGEALPEKARKAGIEFRPQVVYNNLTKQFVMWYEDRWTGQTGYAVAVSDTPEGPFKTVEDTVKVSGPGRVGDYDIFIDDDAVGYHVRTGLVIQKLTSDYLGFTGEYYSLQNSAVEGPAMFKRNGIYYLLVGAGCCACIGGSNILVYASHSPLGDFAFQSDVGTNTSQFFNPYSRLNYVTHAQQTKVFPVPNVSGEIQWIWLGNQWVTSSELGNPRNNDLLYWDILSFNASGTIQQFIRKDKVVISVP